MDATVGSANTSAVSANTTNHNGLPDLINQKGNNGEFEWINLKKGQILMFCFAN